MDTGIIGLILMVINIAVSYNGFKNTVFFEGYKFQVEKILIHKDYKRIITGGFLHTGWVHLIFNMFSLYAFSGNVEGYLGGFQFLIIYFGSLIGGHLFSLLVHKHHGDYSAVGASGAVCGIIFASIALFPGLEIGLFFIPIGIPGWIFGVLFVLFSIYGIKAKNDNIGHEAHLGGALVGMLLALIMVPFAIAENYITILLIAVPAMLFMYIIITRPQLLLIDNFFFKKHQNFYSVDHKYNAQKINEQKEIDKILDKINMGGINSLNVKERQILEEYSRR